PIPELAAPPWQEDLGAAHLEIQAGQITAIRPASQALAPDQPAWDLRQGLVWPCFVDSHTHLDKAHSWPRQANPDGTFGAAVEAVRRDRPHWTAADLYPRMEFALRCSYAHGTQALRTHLDCELGQGPISFEVFQALRAAWAGRLTLQAVALVGLDLYTRPEAEALADLVASHGGVLGGVIYPQPGLPDQLDRAFQLAQERGLDLDFHADESLDPQAEGLRLVAEAKLRHSFSGQVTCGHCCSLAVQTEAQVQTTLDLVQAAGIAVVSLPLCNLYLQDRQAGRMPRHRGVTLLPELSQRGIAVALASDNCRDPFFAYGDHDMLEVFNQSVRIGHLDRPLAHWPQAVTQTPATMMGLPGIAQIGVGRRADLVLFRARTLNELLCRPQSDRLVLRGGIAIDRTLPDYAELDERLTVS
ncbi:MAG TPA: cytosine deaminase, partial [Leptolyngbyaceae cyanobacterium M65_K2018_010]|nr:cytosine deaminase [Leptolyngbyaceae cyanobacterium M65_K2018_010]